VREAGESSGPNVVVVRREETTAGVWDGQPCFTDCPLVEGETDERRRRGAERWISKQAARRAATRSRNRQPLRQIARDERRV